MSQNIEIFLQNSHIHGSDSQCLTRFHTSRLPFGKILVAVGLNYITVTCRVKNGAILLSAGKYISEIRSEIKLIFPEALHGPLFKTPLRVQTSPLSSVL